MSDVGYASIELGEVQLSFKEDPVGEEEELSLRVDLLIEDESNVFRWQTNGEITVSSEDVKPFKKPVKEELATVAALDAEETQAEEGGEPGAPVEGEVDADAAEVPIPNTVYTVSMNNLFKRTQFVDLNNEVLAAFANAKIVIKICPSSAEGEEPVEPLCTFSVPISEVLMTGSGSVSRTSYLSEESAVVGKDTLVGSESFVAWRLLTDNDMTEFCLGCCVLYWKDATITALPTPWSLAYEDVVDPKAKVAPTDEELRAAYLDGVGKLVETQSSVAKYTLSVGTIPLVPVPKDEDEGPLQDDPSGVEETGAPPLLPLLTLGKGNITFNTEIATAVDIAEDIRKKTDLWSLSFYASPTVFLHRSQLRDLASKLDGVSTLPVTLKKTPTEEGVATQGADELVATGTVDLAPLLVPGTSECSFTVSDLAGFGFGETSEESAQEDAQGPVEEEKKEEGGVDENNEAIPVPVPVTPPTVEVSFSASKAIVSRPAVVSSANVEPLKSSGRSVVVSPQRDVLKELKEEIAACVKSIAVEYISKYPIKAAEGSGDVNVKSIDDKKLEFLHYLSSSGIYHTLKESLKPKIQRVVRAEFGVRGQATGKKPSFDVSSSGVNEEKVEGTPGQLLAELYVYLVKVCNQVLNSLYTSTVIDRDTADVDKGAVIDDLDESSTQKLTRFANQAVDCEADGRALEAEQRLLERIQIAKNDEDLSRNPSVEHECYHRLAELNLRRLSSTISAATAVGADAEQTSVACNTYTARAREALTTCVDLIPEEWQARQQLACLLDEAGLYRQAEDMLVEVVQDQLSGMNPGKGGLGSFGDEFDGYGSDKICPVQPLTYAILAAHFSKAGMPLKARKCLRLANRSFIEASVEPNVETHGSPRRTLVLILSQAATWLTSFGFLKLATECATLAMQSEEAANAKAKARDLLSSTPAFIRHAMRRAEAEVGLLTLPSDRLSAQDPQDTARESVMCSENPTDIVDGWLTVSRCAQGGSAMDALLAAIEAACGSGLEGRVPVASYIEATKQLIALGRFRDALPIALTAAKIYSTSAVVLLLVGVINLRLGQVEDAEVALRESNLLDNRNCQVWAYQALVCLQAGSRRSEESDAALFQTLRLGLTAPHILRELATAFMASDKLQIAEDLIRRALTSEPGRGSFTTRKLLGDVLAGQNLAAKAVDEYKAVLEATEYEGDEDYPRTQLAAAERCVTLLQSLGRAEEAKSASAIATKLRTAL